MKFKVSSNASSNVGTLYKGSRVNASYRAWLHWIWNLVKINSLILAFLLITYKSQILIDFSMRLWGYMGLSFVNDMFIVFFLNKFMLKIKKLWAYLVLCVFVSFIIPFSFLFYVFKLDSIVIYISATARLVVNMPPAEDYLFGMMFLAYVFFVFLINISLLVSEKVLFMLHRKTHRY